MLRVPGSIQKQAQRRHDMHREVPAEEIQQAEARSAYAIGQIVTAPSRYPRESHAEWRQACRYAVSFDFAESRSSKHLERLSRHPRTVETGQTPARMGSSPLRPQQPELFKELGEQPIPTRRSPGLLLLRCRDSLHRPVATRAWHGRNILVNRVQLPDVTVVAVEVVFLFAHPLTPRPAHLLAWSGTRRLLAVPPESTRHNRQTLLLRSALHVGP